MRAKVAAVIADRLLDLLAELILDRRNSPALAARALTVALHARKLAHTPIRKPPPRPPINTSTLRSRAAPQTPAPPRC